MAGGSRKHTPEKVSLGFPRSRRLRKRHEYLLVQSQGARVGSPRFLLLLRARPDELPSRLGITVTRKYGNAVSRNRIKRLVREAFRLHTSLLPRGLDVVVVVRVGQAATCLADVSRDLLHVAERIRQQAARLRSELANGRNRSHTAGSTESSSS